MSASAHYEINGGKCGVCGDRWDHPPPRFYESGGIAAEGFLGRRYTPGQIIDVEIALTANHKGYFELRLCPLDGDPTVVERQECFDKYKNLQFLGYSNLETGQTSILTYKM